jgi:single-strand DNA-binding protein
MNNIFIGHGNVGKAPESLVFTNSGKKVVKFSVAIKEFSSKSNEKKTMWLECEAWGELGENVLKLVTKGREIVVNGRLAVSNFTIEEDGQPKKVSRPVIKLTGFDLCGKNPKAPAAENGELQEASE